jgi:hypothetical protein
MLTELEKDKAAGRKAALTKAVDFGRVEAFYLSFGSTIGFCLRTCVTMPARRFFLCRVPGSGLLRTRTTPLVSVEETDMAFNKKANFQAPGQFTSG